MNIDNLASLEFEAGLANVGANDGVTSVAGAIMDIVGDLIVAIMN